MEIFGMELFKDGAVYKLLLALVLGGLVGLEREWHGRAAGLRTHVLVCLGATILLIAARSASETFANDGVINGHLVLDPNRISAGIVTGIGFLGAGAILRMGDLIRGLTTAACIWFVAALGIIIGNGLYVLAVISTLLVLLVLVLFNMIEHTIPPVVYRSLGVTIAAKERDEFEVWCRKRLAANRMRIQETLLRIDSAKGQSEVIFQVRLRGSRRTGTLIEEIGAHPGVRQVRWGQGLERAGGDIRW